MKILLLIVALSGCTARKPIECIHLVNRYGQRFYGPCPKGWVTYEEAAKLFPTEDCIEANGKHGGLYKFGCSPWQYRVADGYGEFDPDEKIMDGAITTPPKIRSGANCGDSQGNVGPCGLIFGRDENGEIMWPEKDE